MEGGADRYGAFGKLPGLGDFLQFGLPPDFHKAWDTWLQAGMLAARESLGDGWQAAYFSAPIWRFSLAAGLCGAAPVSGILMCSVDRVGRQYPLTLARVLPADAPPLATHLAMTREFEALETVALDAMEQDSGRNALEAALAGLDSPISPATVQVTPASDHLDVTYPSETDPSAHVADALARRQFRALSVWSAMTPNGSRVLLYETMPSAARMAVFLSAGKDHYTEHA